MNGRGRESRGCRMVIRYGIESLRVEGLAGAEVSVHPLVRVAAQPSVCGGGSGVIRALVEVGRWVGSEGDAAESSDRRDEQREEKHRDQEVLDLRTDRRWVLGLIVKWVEAVLLISAPSRRPNNTTTRRRIPASDKHDLWIRFQKTSPAGALPFLRTTDQAVSHSGYTWQDAETYSDATPLSTPLTRPKDLICACYPGSWGFLTVLVARCASVHLVDIRPAREQNPALRGPWADGLTSRREAFNRFGYTAVPPKPGTVGRCGS